MISGMLVVKSVKNQYAIYPRLAPSSQHTPPMYIEQVDVIRLQFLQAPLHAHTHALTVIALEIRLDLLTIFA